MSIWFCWKPNSISSCPVSCVTAQGTTYARNHGMDPWQRQDKTEQPRSFVRLIVCSFVCLFVCRIDSRKTRHNSKIGNTLWQLREQSLANATTTATKKRAAPPSLLCCRTSNARCSNHIYFKKSQSNQKSFFWHFCFRNNESSIKPTLPYDWTACRVETTNKQVSSKVPSRRGLAKNKKAKVRLFVTTEQVVAGKCAPPGRKSRQLNNSKQDTGIWDQQKQKLNADYP